MSESKDGIGCFGVIDKEIHAGAEGDAPDMHWIHECGPCHTTLPAEPAADKAHPTRTTVLLRVERALTACFPDVADAIMRELEQRLPLNGTAHAEEGRGVWWTPDEIRAMSTPALRQRYRNRVDAGNATNRRTLARELLWRDNDITKITKIFWVFDRTRGRGEEHAFIGVGNSDTDANGTVWWTAECGSRHIAGHLGTLFALAQHGSSGESLICAACIGATVA